MRERTTRVEIQWIVTDNHGQENGRVVQINEVPIGSLDQYWGDVAVAVATEAAGGVAEVVTNAIGRGPKTDEAKTAAPTTVRCQDGPNQDWAHHRSAGKASVDDSTVNDC